MDRLSKAVQQQQYLFGKKKPGCQKGQRPIKAGHPKVKWKKRKKSQKENAINTQKNIQNRK